MCDKCNFVRILAVAALYLCTVTLFLMVLVPKAENPIKWFQVNGYLNFTQGLNFTVKTAVDAVKPGVSIEPLYPRVLLYNRVPKCASSTTGTMMTFLAKTNGFTHFWSKTDHTEWVNVTERKRLNDKWLQTALYTRFSFMRHFYFFNVSGFREGEVTWMNIVRDPVERFISDYYYKKFILRVMFQNGTEEYRKSLENMDMDQCVAEKIPECYPHQGDNRQLQLSFFCGHDPLCTTVGDRWALQMAKSNIEAFYSVVGIKEDLHTTYQVLQQVLPKFFHNYEYFLYGLGYWVVNARFSEFILPVSNATKSILRDCMKEDEVLYQFVKSRLYQQSEMLREMRENTRENTKNDNQRSLFQILSG